MSGYEVNATTKTCPACEGLIPADAVLCTRCGLNLKTGSRLREADRDPNDARHRAEALKKARAAGDMETVERIAGPKAARPSAVTCPSCGYDMAGLTGKTCPECGHTRGARADREAQRLKNIETYWRTTWLVAGIGGAAGLAVTILAGMGLAGMDMTGCLIHFAACHAALFAGYFGICLAFLGFEEDVRGLALRLVGVGSVWSALWLVVPGMGMMGAYGIAISAILSVAALAVPVHTLTERDWDDSAWIAFVSWVLKIILGIVVALLI